jgi:hypothetical protein
VLERPLAESLQRREPMDPHVIEAALNDIDYPAPRNKLIAVALERGAPAAVIARLRELPETADFQSAADASRALGAQLTEEVPTGGWE